MEFITPDNFEDFIIHIHDKLFKLFFQRTAVMVECLTRFCPTDNKTVDYYLTPKYKKEMGLTLGQKLYARGAA